MGTMCANPKTRIQRELPNSVDSVVAATLELVQTALQLAPNDSAFFN